MKYSKSSRIKNRILRYNVIITRKIRVVKPFFFFCFLVLLILYATAAGNIDFDKTKKYCSLVGRPEGVE